MSNYLAAVGPRVGLRTIATWLLLRLLVARVLRELLEGGARREGTWEGVGGWVAGAGSGGCPGSTFRRLGGLCLQVAFVIEQ